VPYVPEQMPSPRAQELGQKLALVISEFQQRNPDVSDEEIRVATQLAAGHLTARGRTTAVFVSTAVAALAAAGVIFYLQRDNSGAAHVPWVVIGTGAIILVGALAVLRRRS